MIKIEKLSKVQQKHHSMKKGHQAILGCERLVTDVEDKQNYVVHYRALQTYIELGCVVTKVHRGIKFSQKAIFKDYIDLLSAKRAAAAAAGNKFLANLCKAAANMIYGKTVESVRGRSTSFLVRSREQALRYLKKPTVASVKILDTDDGSDLALVRLKNLSCTLNKPVAMGVCILDNAKRVLNEWFYGYAIPKFNGDPANPRLITLMTDTDSVYCYIKQEPTGKKTVYDEIYEDRRFFDMSVYNPNCPVLGQFHDPTNMKRPGVIHDESPDKIITSFDFCSPKNYCYDTERPRGTADAGKVSSTIKCKGINRTAVAKQLTSDIYRHVIQNNLQHFVTITAIRKHLHDIYTEEINKLAIKVLDVKRVWWKDGITLPIGHWRLREDDQEPDDKEPDDDDRIHTYLTEFNQPILRLQNIDDDDTAL